MTTQQNANCQHFTRMFWDGTTDDLFAFAVDLRRQARLQKPMLPAACESLARRTVEIAIDPQTAYRPYHQTACLAVAEALAIWIGRCKKPELMDVLEDLVRACWVFHAPKSNQVQAPAPKKAKQNAHPKQPLVEQAPDNIVETEIVRLSQEQPPVGDVVQARRRMWATLSDMGLSEGVVRHIALDLFGDRSTRNLTANQVERIIAQIRAFGADIQQELNKGRRKVA